MTEAELLDLAEQVVAEARRAGADEVTACTSTSTQTSLQRRAGLVEQATEATTNGLLLSVLVGDRYCSSSTSDLRPEARREFVARCVSATRYLEPDPARRLPDPASCGRGATAEALDQDDPSWPRHETAVRHAECSELEAALVDSSRGDAVSTTAYVADGTSLSARVTSNGFADTDGGTFFAIGGDMTLRDGERLPEGSASFTTRYHADLPPLSEVAALVSERTRERIGSKAVASGTYPMLLPPQVAGRLLAVLAGPLSGSAIHEGRSCLAGKVGESIASERLTLVDDPMVPRGLGSRPFDGDGLVAKRRTIVSRGVLLEHAISVYYGRKLDRPPTSGSRSNWVPAPGEGDLQTLRRSVPRAIEVTGFLGGNSNGTTGDFSFGIRGVLIEGGVPVQSLSEMNVSGNLVRVLQSLVAVGADAYTHSSIRSPSMLFDGVQFSGT